MSAIQEQTKSLKINATNIKSVLVGKNRRLKNLRKIKSRIVDVNLRQAKQAKVASNFGGGSGGGGLPSPAMDILDFGAKLLAGIVKIVSLLALGFVINHLPAIISTLKSVWKTIKPAVTLVWDVLKFIGRTMWNFGKWVISIWNPDKAKDNIDQIDQGNKDLTKDLEDLVPEENLGEIDDPIEGEEGAGGGDSGEIDAPEPESAKEELKPTTTSTSPPSPADGSSKDGTSNQLVKNKPPIEKTKSRTAGGDLPEVTDKKKKAAIEELIDLTRRRLNLKRVIPNQKDPEIKAEWQAELNRINERQKVLTSIISGSGAKITPIPKTTDITSLGKAKPNSPTVIVIPMKETKVKTVTVNGGSGGTVLTGSVSSPQPSKIRNSVI